MMIFFKYFIFELKLRLRNPSQVFFIFIFPIFLMVAFASSFGKNVPNYIPDNIALIMFYSVLSASVTSMSVQISEYHSGQIYSLFRQRGISQLLYLIAQVLTFMLIIFFATIAILLVAHLSYDYEIPAFSTLIIFYLKLYLYSLPFYFIALIIGLLSRNTTTASAIALPLMFVSYFLSGMMVPLSLFSGKLKEIAEHFFLSQLLSDLTYSLTKQQFLQPDWLNIGASVFIIISLSFFVLYQKSRKL